MGKTGNKEINMLNLENVYFYTIKENAVIFKMSKESLDEFISENSLSVRPGYKNAQLITHWLACGLKASFCSDKRSFGAFIFCFFQTFVLENLKNRASYMYMSITNFQTAST